MGVLYYRTLRIHRFTRARYGSGKKSGQKKIVSSQNCVCMCVSVLGNLLLAWLHHIQTAIAYVPRNEEKGRFGTVLCVCVAAVVARLKPICGKVLLMFMTLKHGAVICVKYETCN